MVTLATVAVPPSVLAGQLRDVNRRSTTHERVEGNGWVNRSGLATLVADLSQAILDGLRRLLS